MNASKLHRSIQEKIGSYNDLVPVEFHSLWPRTMHQFVSERLVYDGVIKMPKYWFSPSRKSIAGFWDFRTGKIPSSTVVSEETILTLTDDVTGELATRISLSDEKAGLRTGFTVNLKMTKTGASPSCRLLYFQAYMLSYSGRKATIECPVFDAENGEKIAVIRDIFVFMPLTNKRINKMESDANSKHGLPERLLDSQDSLDLSAEDIHTLGELLPVVPHGIAPATSGKFSPIQKKIAVVYNFGKRLNGPPFCVHGGLLATTLSNLSALLYKKLTGQNVSTLDTVLRDVNYIAPVPSESMNVHAEAAVKDIEDNKIVIIAKIIVGGKVRTTLETTCVSKAPSAPSSKL